MEEWRTIKEFPTYEVSDRGNVRHRNIGRPHWKEKPLKQKFTGRGYLQVKLWDGERARTRQVHVLVLRAFTGPPKEGEESHHLDGNRYNNRLDNLSYCSHAYNIIEAYRDGRCERSNATYRLNEEAVRVIKWFLRNTQTSVKKLAELHRVPINVINNIKYGTSWRWVQITKSNAGHSQEMLSLLEQMGF